jgi:hypothetical protein
MATAKHNQGGKRNKAKQSQAQGTGQNNGRTGSKQNPSRTKQVPVDKIRSQVDKGDDMQRRIHYQAQYAAIKSLELLKDDCPIECLYCEHHEDLLAKLRSGGYVGIQVKTRDAHLPNFKATDEPIMESIGRFIELHAKYQGQFERFVIAVNRAFERTSNKHDIRHLIHKSVNKTVHAVLRNYFSANFNTHHKKLNRPYSQVDLQKILRMLVPEDDLPDFAGAEAELIKQIVDLGYERLSYKTIQDAAITLTNAMRSAAILPSTRSHAAIFAPNPQDAVDAQIIAGKQITKVKVAGLLNGILQFNLPRQQDLNKLRNRQVQSLSNKATVALLNAFAAASSSLLQWPSTLDGSTWLEPQSLRELQTCIESDTTSTTLLLGSSGTGKSALLSRLAAEYSKAGSVILGIKADFLPVSIDSAEGLASHLGISGTLQEAVLGLCQKQTVILLLDQLDAVSDLADLKSVRLNVLLNLVKDLAGTHNVHIILSARAYEAMHDSRLRSLDIRRIELQLPTWEQVELVLQGAHIDITSLSDEFKQVLRRPQFLKVFLSLQGHNND